jgi:hypothetical protein
MVANTSTANDCLDFFSAVGAMRGWSDSDIIRVFSKAMSSDPATAVRILFWVRDIRGGQGERRVFRLCFNFLNEHYREFVDNNLEAVPFYGRWDDMFHLDNSNVLTTIANGLERGDGLLAKWLPRKKRLLIRCVSIYDLLQKSTERRLLACPKLWSSRCAVMIGKVFNMNMCLHRLCINTTVPSIAMMNIVSELTLNLS